MKKRAPYKRVDQGSGIKTVVRFRPMLDIEMQVSDNQPEVFTFPDPTVVSVKRGVDNFETFTFDRVFTSQSTQQEIFDFVGKPIIDDILTGYNGTVFAYGQTGSGKSFTMTGLDLYEQSSMGIIPRANSLIFSTLQQSSKEIEYTLRCSMLEIYKETLKDLLGNSTAKLKIKQDPRKGIYVEGLTEIYVISEEEMMDVLELGEYSRSVASTKMNKFSSRSHQLFILEVVQKLPDETEKRGILNLVDLAGSEKISQSGATGNNLEEAKKINLSLSALGNVINALTSKSDHVPYRDSKLTRLLQESLGGNYKTTIIVTCSPHLKNLDDTLNTLKFAQRAKSIKNMAKLNIKKSPEVYMTIIKKLKEKLEDLKLENSKLKNEFEFCMIQKSNTLSVNYSMTKYGDDLANSPLSISDFSLSPSITGTGTFSDMVSPFLDSNKEVDNLKEENQSLENKIDDLEQKLAKENRKRLKLEIESAHNFENYQKMLLNTKNKSNHDDYLIQENKNLKQHVEMLETHLQQANQRFLDLLGKLNSGQLLTESDFIDVGSNSKSDFILTMEDPYTTLITEFDSSIDTPLNDILRSNSKFSSKLQEAIEESSQISSETFIYHLKSQLIQAGLINCQLLRSYYDATFKFNILSEKLDLKNKLISYQEEKIIDLEKSFEQMCDSNARIVQIVTKLEQERPRKEEDHFKPKIVKRYKIKPLDNNAHTPMLRPASIMPMQRSDNRTRTITPRILDFKSRILNSEDKHPEI